MRFMSCIVLILLLAGSFALAAPRFANSDANVSAAVLQEMKQQIFGDQGIATLEGDAESDRYYSVPSRSTFEDLVSREYVAWKRAGLEMTRDKDGKPRFAFVADPARASSEYASVERLRKWISELGFDQVGFVDTDIGQMIAAQDSGRPRAGALDLFQVPGILERLSKISVSLEQFLTDLKQTGHFFLLVRGNLDPPTLQEEVLYIRSDAPHLKPYSFIGPAYEVRWD